MDDVQSEHCIQAQKMPTGAGYNDVHNIANEQHFGALFK